MNLLGFFIKIQYNLDGTNNDFGVKNMIKVYTDAAVKGNPGRAGIGMLIVQDGIQRQLSKPIEEYCDNHLAEFLACLEALRCLFDEKKCQEWIFLYSDSKIVVQSIKKRYVKQPEYRKVLDEILVVLEQFPTIEMEWIPETMNKGADQLAKQALQKRLKQQRGNAHA